LAFENGPALFKVKSNSWHKFDTMQFLTRGLGQAILRSPKAVETGKGTVVVTQRNRSRQQSLSTLPPSPHGSGDNVDHGNTSGSTTNFKPVNLAYRALEYRGQERENPTKSPLIIHHSLYGRKENWNPISEIINRTTMRKIINVDARNHGESPHTKEMSLPLMTKDIVHLIKQTKKTQDSADADLSKFSFMGHHLGGRIGMILALTQPQLVNKLIVVDASVLVNEKCRERWLNLRRACFVLLDIESQIREAHGYERMNIASKAIENVIVDKKDRAHFLSSVIFSEKSNDSSKLWRVNLASYLSNPDMMLQVPTLDNAVFEGQALFINGDRSQYVSRDHSEAILKVFPNAEFAWIKDSGHLLHIDNPNDFCEKIITFLEN